MPYLEVPEAFLDDFSTTDLEGGRRKKRSAVKGCSYRGSKVYKTKKGGLFVYKPSGQTRFVKKSHCKMSRRR